MLRAISAIQIRQIGWVKAGIYALILAFVYQSVLRHLILSDWYRDDYTHCFLIPFVVIYMIWEKRQELSVHPSLPSWTGLVPFIIGVILFWLGDLSGEYFTLYLSFWFVIIGLLWLHLGWLKIKTIWFSLTIMLAMFPFPYFINKNLSLQLQLISSKLGVWMVHLYGMPEYREGNVIDLGFTQLQVVEACSGLRYLIPIMVLALLLAYFFKAHLWKRILLFVSSIPLAIVVNSMRIALTGILYSVWGAKVAEGFFHGFSGWMIFIFALGFLLVAMWVLSWLGPRKGSRFKVQGSEERESSRLKVQGSGEDNEEKRICGKEEGESVNADIRVHAYTRTRVYVFVVAIILLTVTAVLSKSVEFREKVPIAKSFNQFPAEIGEWTGKRQTMDQQYLNALSFSDYIIADYRNSAGKEINFYIAYYETQRKGESIHSPETCLPGGGWIFRESGAATITLAGNNPGSITVNRALMEKPGTRELVYFWFPMRGRVLTTLYGVKLANFWDAMTRQRTDGALVRVMTQIDEKETMAEAESRLAGFTKEVVPILDQFIPK